MKKYKSLGIYAVLILIIALIVMLLMSGTSARKLKYTDIINEFKDGKVQTFTIDNTTLKLELKEPVDGSKEQSFELYSVSLFLDDVEQMCIRDIFCTFPHILQKNYQKILLRC